LAPSTTWPINASALGKVGDGMQAPVCNAADSWWVSLLKDIILVLFGFFLSLFPARLERRRRVSGNWAALAAEAETCERLAGAYLADNVPAPLYRFPEAAFSTSFPELLAEGEIGRLEARQLTEFRAAVQEVNRGLDRAGEAHAAKDNTLLKTEADRLRIKCENILNGRGTTLPEIFFIREVLERHAGSARDFAPIRRAP
jgi:signal transduction histidine kinase